ncbi:hypothetical protein EV359DRAFT_69199 [Lentinula novae-zelandiae]|nr:hypothetical protein EV359DRAFT_69199 [Lentinula novae-zelandiae]
MQTQSSCGRDDIGVKIQNKKCRRGIRSWGSVHIGISDDNIEITSPKKRDGKSKTPPITIPTENWLWICELSGHKLTALAEVWIQVGGRVLRLVKQLQLGEIRGDMTLLDNLVKMENLTRLTINATTLTWEMIREIVQMENLRGLTLQQVCIIETHEESVEGVLHLEHV